MSNVQVLQGLNLDSEISVIKINVHKTDTIVRYLELLKNFHPIFMREYKFENDILSIHTMITSLWRELGEIIIKLSEGKIDYEEARKHTLEEVLKQRVASMSTIPLIFFANKMKYEVTPTLLEDERIKYNTGPNRIYTLGVGRNSQIIYSISSSKDSKEAKEIQRDKYLTNLMIQRLGLPIPKWQVLDNISQIEEVWSSYEKPVVIKPTGLTGGHGVVVGIETLEKAKEAFKFAKEATQDRIREEWQQKIMIQEQISGEDYRLLVINGHLEIATKRIPAFIIGDGKHTIEELIDITNTDPRRDVTNPTHTLKPIKIDDPLKSYIKDQKLTLTSIPKKEQKVNVRKVASMSQGGITEDFTDKVSPEIKAIVESIASSIHAFTLGVDVMCKDLSKPLTKDNGAILEVNTMPEAYLNTYPVIGESREYVFDKYIKALLEGNNTKQIVIVGNSTEDVPTLLRKKSIFGSYLKQDAVIGEYKDGEIRINGLDINKGLEKWKAIEGLKVNASLDAMIIHHRNVEEVRETGLGFNKIDLLMVESKYFEDREFKKAIRRYQMKGLISKIKKF
jgi:D-alanine-D-alanine ligase-like ATP-grasp enzyme